MNAETFLEQFETFAEAPNGVEQLRAMILQLAVQGKLVPQDPSVEPDCSDTCVEDFLTVQNGYAFKSDWFISGGVRLVRNVNIGHGELRWDDVACVSDERAREFNRFELREGDIVISLDRPLISTGLKVARITRDDLPALLLQRVGKPQFKDDRVLPEYFFLWLNSPAFTGAIDPGKSNGVPHIAAKDIHRIRFSPPSPETQKRIVAKVDQLLALCDELAARQEARRVARTQLVGATLDRLVSTRSPADLAPHVHRLRNHFDHLFDTPTTIPQLRQTILQLAVQGQLVCDVAYSGWNTKTLDELIDPIYPISYGVLKPGPHVPGGVPLIKSQHIRNWQVSEKIDDCISHELDNQYRRTRIKGGEILINLVGASIGRCAIAPTSLRGANVSRAVAVITLKDNIDTQFVLTMLSAVFTSSWINSTCTGSAQPVFNLGDLRKVRIPIPSIAIQKEVVTKVNELLRLCDALESQLSTTESARSQLLSASIHYLLGDN